MVEPGGFAPLNQEIEDGTARSGEQVEVRHEKNTKETAETKDAGEGLGTTKVVSATGDAGLFQNQPQRLRDKAREKFRNVIV